MKAKVSSLTSPSLDVFINLNGVRGSIYWEFSWTAKTIMWTMECQISLRVDLFIRRNCYTM